LVLPTQLTLRVSKNSVALSKARSQNASWGGGAGEDVERPISAVAAKAKPNLSQVVEDDDDFEDDDPALMSGEGAVTAGEENEEGEDANGDGDEFSRAQSAFSGVSQHAAASYLISLLHSHLNSVAVTLFA
jgi:hypothetical protein